jgi:hypothetical protein
MRLWYLGIVALTSGAAAISSAAEISDQPPGRSEMMVLQNLQGPFVNRDLAATIARAVVSAKYPVALSKDPPKISDEGETWLVTFKVERWTQGAQMLRGIKAIPISIRKKDAAIIDIFPHHATGETNPDAARKRMTTDVACKGCHLTHVGASR